MLELKTIHHRDEWDKIVALLPAAHVLQSWDWGGFKSRWGWTVQRLLWRDAESPVAAAQVLRRAVPYTPWNFLYIPKGPLLDYANAPLLQQILAHLESYAKEQQALFIKIDPDVVRQYGEPHSNPPLETSGQATLDLLARRGWRFSPEQIQFRNTVLVDLTPDCDELLVAMKSKWRYNIRLATRKGVTIHSGTAADIDTFYQMYAQTAARDGFLIRPKAYYEDVWQQFLATGQAEMILASVEEEIVAGLMLFIFGQTAWYLYGASTGQYRSMMPNYALQWAAMRRAKEQGCQRYDLWGAPDVFDESDRMWGVYRFKQGFGGQVVQGLGAFDYPANRPLYWAFTGAMPKLRTLLRRLTAKT